MGVKTSDDINFFDRGVIREIEVINFEESKGLHNFNNYPYSYTIELTTRTEIIHNVRIVLGSWSGGDNFQVYEKGTHVLVGYIRSFSTPFILGPISRKEEIIKSFSEDRKSYMEPGEKISSASGSSIKHCKDGKLALVGKAVDKYSGEEEPVEVLLGGLQTLHPDTKHQKALVLRCDKGEIGVDIKGNVFSKFLSSIHLGNVTKYIVGKLFRVVVNREDGRIELDSDVHSILSRKYFRLFVGGSVQPFEEADLDENIVIAFGNPDDTEKLGTATILGGKTLKIRVNKAEISINRDDDDKVVIDSGNGNEIEMNSINGSITINGGNVTITGGSLTVTGSAAGNMKGPFCSISNCLFTGMPHRGSKVQGT